MTRNDLMMVLIVVLLVVSVVISGYSVYLYHKPIVVTETVTETFTETVTTTTTVPAELRVETYVEPRNVSVEVKPIIESGFISGLKVYLKNNGDKTYYKLLLYVKTCDYKFTGTCKTYEYGIDELEPGETRIIRLKTYGLISHYYIILLYPHSI